jgi:hypothetical protein
MEILEWDSRQSRIEAVTARLVESQNLKVKSEPAAL